MYSSMTSVLVMEINAASTRPPDSTQDKAAWAKVPPGRS
jgi:hypothetical protein